MINATASFFDTYTTADDMFLMQDVVGMGRACIYLRGGVKIPLNDGTDGKIDHVQRFMDHWQQWLRNEDLKQQKREEYYRDSIHALLKQLEDGLRVANDLNIF